MPWRIYFKMARKYLTLSCIVQLKHTNVISLLYFWEGRHVLYGSLTFSYIGLQPHRLFHMSFLILALFSTLQASCLCGSAPCLLCGCCPSSNNSTVTRLVFSFFLLLGTLVSVIMILPGMETQLRKVSPSWAFIPILYVFCVHCFNFQHFPPLDSWLLSRRNHDTRNREPC